MISNEKVLNSKHNSWFRTKKSWIRSTVHDFERKSLEFEAQFKVSNTTLGPKILWKSKSFTKPTFRIRTAISGRLSTSSRQGASDADLKTLKTETLKNENYCFASIDFQDFSIFFHIFHSFVFFNNVFIKQGECNSRTLLQ